MWSADFFYFLFTNNFHKSRQFAHYFSAQFMGRIEGSKARLMHNWRGLNIMILLAPRYQGHSLLGQCYEFCLHATIYATHSNTASYVYYYF